MPNNTNREKLAQYICEIGSDLIPLLKTHGLGATAHCLEMAVSSAATAVNQPGGLTQRLPRLGRGSLVRPLRTQTNAGSDSHNATPDAGTPI